MPVMLRPILTSLLVAALAAPLGAAARNPLTSLHPEDMLPNDAAPLATPDVHAPFISRVQERLKLLGFDAGTVNGDFGAKTQSALAQFQLANILPASGQLDDATLEALGVTRDPQQQPQEQAATTQQ